MNKKYGVIVHRLGYWIVAPESWVQLPVAPPILKIKLVDKKYGLLRKKQKFDF